MSTTAESRKGTTKGNASEFSPRITHCSDPYGPRRTDDSNGITSIAGEVIGSIATDYLISTRACIEYRDLSRLNSKLCFHALQPAQYAPANPLLPTFHSVEIRHVVKIMIPQLSQQEAGIFRPSLAFLGQRPTNAKSSRVTQNRFVN
jgi:hypothetical protein